MKQMETVTQKQYALFDQARKQQKRIQADSEDLQILEKWQKDLKKQKN